MPERKEVLMVGKCSCEEIYLNRSITGGTEDY